MTKITVHLVASIQDCTLVVFYTLRSQRKCNFGRLVRFGAVFRERKIYYTAFIGEESFLGSGLIREVEKRYTRSVLSVGVRSVFVW